MHLIKGTLKLYQERSEKQKQINEVTGAKPPHFLDKH